MSDIDFSNVSRKKPPQKNCKQPLQLAAFLDDQLPEPTLRGIVLDLFVPDLTHAPLR
jgi:hypothetical protein